ncbi:MerR family transcriptional regulator [Streptomyces sp. NPDC055055]
MNPAPGDGRAPEPAGRTGDAAPGGGGAAETAPAGTHTALRSGQVAAAAGVNVQTLRYYERRGLLAAPRRSSGGHRLYDADSVTALRVIKAAQRLGFTLDEVAELLDTGRHRHGQPATGLRERAASKLAEVDARIADLTTIRATLLDAVQAGCDDLTTCAATARCPIPFTALADDHHTPGPHR